MWEKHTSTGCYVGKYTSTGCIPEKTTSTRLKDNLSMTEEIQVWRMPPSLRASVEVLHFGQSFSIRKYKKTHLYHYISPKKKLKTQEEMSASPVKDKK
jgi:hypothetical protein